jgi:hypothetical protein
VSFFSSVNIIMAEMYTPEEIAQISAAYNDAVEKNIPISKELAQQMKDATLGVKNYTQQLQSSLKQLGTSVKTLGSNLAKGEKGASVYSDSLSSGADALAAYTAKFGPAGRALGFATKAITAFGVAAMKQSDQLFDSFQKVSRAGAIGAGGITELYDSMKKLGYVPAELERMGQLFAENSKYLALYSSSATEGGKMFATVADTIQNSPLRAQLFNLGMSVDDINKGVAGYIKQEGSLGKLRGTNQAQLEAGTKSYLREMEILTRLTGQSREEMETQREQALSIDAFYATLKELGPDAREQALQTFNQMSAVSTKAAAEFASNFSGAITGTTDLLMSTGGASMKYTKEFFEKGGKSTEAMQGMADGAQKFVGVTDQIAKIGGQFGLTSREITMLTNKGLDPFGEAFKKTAEQVDAAKAGADRTTDSQAKLRDSNIKTGQNMADFVNLGVKPATIAMQGLSAAVEYLTSFLPGAKRFKANQDAGGASGTMGGFDTGAGGSGGDQTGAGAGTAQLTAKEAGVEGLRVKSSEAYAGGETSEQLSGVARAIQEKLGGDLKYFSAFNDSYDRKGNSLHRKGRALDFTLTDASKSAAVASMIRSIPGISYVKDEYLTDSASKTGGHIHAEISAANGAILSGPRSGYQPNLTMHGTEAVVPLPDGRSIPVSGSSESSGLMAAQLDKLDELISVMKSQLSVSNKLLSYSS